MTVYTCQFCGKESDDEQKFITDVKSKVAITDLTCETCYDALDEMDAKGGLW